MTVYIKTLTLAYGQGGSFDFEPYLDQRQKMNIKDFTNHLDDFDLPGGDEMTIDMGESTDKYSVGPLYFTTGSDLTAFEGLREQLLLSDHETPHTLTYTLSDGTTDITLKRNEYAAAATLTVSLSRFHSKYTHSGGIEVNIIFEAVSD